jgi:hypothetical protein
MLILPMIACAPDRISANTVLSRATWSRNKLFATATFNGARSRYLRSNIYSAYYNDFVVHFSSFRVGIN